jgi:hypothetical protein
MSRRHRRHRPRRAQPIVRDYCLEHGIACTETGLIESYRIALRHLDEVGTHTLP